MVANVFGRQAREVRRLVLEALPHGVIAERIFAVLDLRPDSGARRRRAQALGGHGRDDLEARAATELTAEQRTLVVPADPWVAGTPLYRRLADLRAAETARERAMDQARQRFQAIQRWLIDGFHTPVYRWKVRQWATSDPAIRKALGDATTLIVDANGSYRSGSTRDDEALHALAGDDLALAAIEQPYPPDDLVGHARLAAAVATPVCLDESIGSLGDVDTALALGACGAVSLKVGRVGGLAEARRIHDRCRDAGVALRCGGMLETGLGRAVNLAVAALPGCTLPPDLGPSARYFADDLTVPFTAEGGSMAVPQRPGLGVAPRPEALEAATVETAQFRADRRPLSP